MHGIISNIGQKEDDKYIPPGIWKVLSYFFGAHSSLLNVYKIRQNHNELYIVSLKMKESFLIILNVRITKILRKR